MLCIGLEQKNVIIQRDRFGYGLTVSGDNPVYVLSVREGGAAHRAGINTNDQIIKVRIVGIQFYI
jgi:Rho guanine nucleotide exchange factor 12